MAENTDRDLAYISNPNLWVHIWCPLKRYKNRNLEIAYMIGDGPIIRHGNMYNSNPSDRKEPFESYAAILEAGWRVD